VLATANYSKGCLQTWLFQKLVSLIVVRSISGENFKRYAKDLLSDAGDIKSPKHFILQKPGDVVNL
jgi:hypothetical protein